MTELQRRFIFPIKLNTKSSISRKLVCPCIQYRTCVIRVAWIPLMCEAVVMCLVQRDPLLPCVRLHARFSARMNILKRNVKNTCITGQTVACDQCRIKVFGAIRLDTLMGPYRHIPSHGSLPTSQLRCITSRKM